MEHISLSVIAVGSKEFAVGGSRLEDTLIHSNQSITAIDRWGYGDRNISLGSINSCSEMWRFGYGRNRDDGIPQIKIGRFNLFDGGTPYFDDRSTLWHVADIIENEDIEGEINFRTPSKRIVLKLKKLVANILKSRITPTQITPIHITSIIFPTNLPKHIWKKIFYHNKYCHGIVIQWTQQLVTFLRKHHWLIYHWYIQPIYPLQYICCIFTLRYLLHEYLLIEQFTLYYHCMTHQKKVWHLNSVLRPSTTHPNWHGTYQLN